MDKDVHPTVAETTHDLLQGSRHDVAALRADLNHVRGTMAELQSAGTVRRALSVVKKRSGNHEHTIREFRLGSTGIKVGPPLRDFMGIFSGNPRYTGNDIPEGSAG